MSSNLIKSKVHFSFNGTQVHKKRQELNFLSVFLFYLKSKMQNLNVKSKFLKKINNTSICLCISTFHISKHLWN